MQDLDEGDDPTDLAACGNNADDDEDGQIDYPLDPDCMR